MSLDGVCIHTVVSYACFHVSAVLMTLFRAAIHLPCSTLLSATNRVTPSDMLSNMAFFLTHTSFN